MVQISATVKNNFTDANSKSTFSNYLTNCFSGVFFIFIFTLVKIFFNSRHGNHCDTLNIINDLGVNMLVTFKDSQPGPFFRATDIFSNSAYPFCPCRNCRIRFSHSSFSIVYLIAKHITKFLLTCCFADLPDNMFIFIPDSLTFIGFRFPDASYT